MHGWTRHKARTKFPGRLEASDRTGSRHPLTWLTTVSITMMDRLVGTVASRGPDKSGRVVVRMGILFTALLALAQFQTYTL